MLSQLASNCQYHRHISNRKTNVIGEAFVFRGQAVTSSRPVGSPRPGLARSPNPQGSGGAVRSWRGAVLVTGSMVTGSMVTGSVAAGCGADDAGEGGDEAAGVRPSAGVGDVGRVVAVGEQDECVIDA